MGHRTAGAALAFCAALAWASALGQENAQFPPGRIDKGRSLYAAHCESCHGVRMIGPQWGVELSKFPRDSPARFADSVTNGIRGMPPWGDVLKPDDIEALWAYVVAGEKN
jgi:mono/diheme cytochrome c family protein